MLIFHFGLAIKSWKFKLQKVPTTQSVSFQNSKYLKLRVPHFMYWNWALVKTEVPTTVNSSFQSGIVPKCLKVVMIELLKKAKKNTEIAKNVRGINITPILLKNCIKKSKRPNGWSLLLYRLLLQKKIGV